MSSYELAPYLLEICQSGLLCQFAKLVICNGSIGSNPIVSAL